MGDDRSALQAVVAADTELMELREEEEEINAKLQDTTLDDKTFDADEASERLNEASCSGIGPSVWVTTAASRGSVRGTVMLTTLLRGCTRCNHVTSGVWPC